MSTSRIALRLNGAIGQSVRSRASIYAPICRQRISSYPAAIQAWRPFSTTFAVEEKRYTQDHEWVEINDDIATIGISTYAAKALGDVVYVELPKSETTVTAGDTIGAVESVKSASDIMSPISGEVVEANDVLEEKPGTINRSPEGEGWIAKLKVDEAGKKEVGGLMDAKAYEKFTEE